MRYDVVNYINVCLKSNWSHVCLSHLW